MFDNKDENNYLSIIGSSLRNVIENSITDLVLPYKILCQSHVSSWNTFQNDLIQILKRNSNLNQDFLLFHHLHFHQTNHSDDKHFQCLMNSHILIPIETHFHH